MRIAIVVSVVARMVLVCVLAVLFSGFGGAAKGKLGVVSSTNVYGDIVRQIGGPNVSVTSVLTDPNADPHLFEPGTANGLAVARARLVIVNGLGYDAFMTRLERAAPNPKRQTVTIADAVGVHGSDANPHLWYDVPALGTIARAIEHALAAADKPHARDYASGLDRFLRSLGPLRGAVASIRAAHAGAPVAYTEPVPGYLLQAAGLRNLAPASFTRAIEEGTEPSASAVATMLGLVSNRRVRVLLYNKQAVSPITARVRAAAQHAGVPVVAVTETLPPGLSFQSWQLLQTRALARALGG
jgi:zinc/manganese transport system substrate-binding protein